MAKASSTHIDKSTHIDESTLTKGQRRKLNALRKSVGDEIGAQAFAAWLSSQQAAGTTADANAASIVDTLWPLVQRGALSIPRGGYLLRRGRIIVEPPRVRQRRRGGRHVAHSGPIRSDLDRSRNPPALSSGKGRKTA